MTQARTLLATFAHPDDEAFGTGGTLARYAATGTHVALVCTTRGEVGEISDPTLATPETLGTVRETELRCACRILGFNDLTLLGYRDSGMRGTPENDDPRAYINAAAAEVVPRLVGIIRRLRPQVVITFEPNGGYGHPDHIAIHHHTVAAFQAASDPTQYPDQGPLWQPARLIYSVIPGFIFQNMRAKMQELNLDTSDFDQFFENSPFEWWPDDQIHFTLDVSQFIESKWAALHCHQTQFGEDNTFRRLPEAINKQLMSHEYFALAWPEPSPGLHFDDLFAGLP
jgi:LmbE family N-acetylglucosaminyl deacetylase